MSVFFTANAYYADPCFAAGGKLPPDTRVSFPSHVAIISLPFWSPSPLILSFLVTRYIMASSYICTYNLIFAKFRIKKNSGIFGIFSGGGQQFEIEETLFSYPLFLPSFLPPTLPFFVSQTPSTTNLTSSDSKSSHFSFLHTEA